MKYNFIEIGTSNFNTLIEAATEDTVGISIEPLKKYLDQLPNPKNVLKVNCAVSFDGSEDAIDFYYIDPSIIKDLNLKPFFRGCNSIGNYHPMHLKYNLQKYVSIEKVQQKTYKSIIQEYSVTELEYLKIDTEGGDCKIMEQVFANKELLLPKKIKFETNSLADPIEVSKIITLFSTIGYVVSYDNKARRDTILTLHD